MTVSGDFKGGFQTTREWSLPTATLARQNRGEFGRGCRRRELGRIRTFGKLASVTIEGDLVGGGGF
jgi:hypothetical protein